MYKQIYKLIYKPLIYTCKRGLSKKEAAYEILVSTKQFL